MLTVLLFNFRKSFGLSSVIILLFVLGFSSCSIEKRVHLQGYHINFHKSKLKSSENQSKLAVSGRTVVSKRNNRPGALIEPERKGINATEELSAPINNELPAISAAATGNTPIHFMTIGSRNESPVDKRIKKEPLFADEIDEPQNNTMAILALIATPLSLLLFPALAALLFGAIAIRQFKKNPGMYKNKWMAILGLVVGYIGSLFSLFFFFAGFVFGGPIFLIPITICFLDIVLSTILLVSKP